MLNVISECTMSPAFLLTSTLAECVNIHTVVIAFLWQKVLEKISFGSSKSFTFQSLKRAEPFFSNNSDSVI